MGEERSRMWKGKLSYCIPAPESTVVPADKVPPSRRHRRQCAAVSHGGKKMSGKNVTDKHQLSVARRSSLANRGRRYNGVLGCKSAFNKTED